MGIRETPPEDLAERELFAEFVELLDESAESGAGYSEARLRARRADLLAEIGDRLEALEAAKSLIGGVGPESEPAPRHEPEVN
ncbi:hypothetical protein [Halococcus saccharolyticus]|uniref:Uncharacterized protein n=1 Tax=Halococcus saccharolyticus DSM 5350 TaxID=1227455 RepID=M0MSZ0_9EURY|nr:hypothetical protein [Halococcus saccharolyticus]EMA47864.1 hypothetical protein C449_00290 [Halococcus saccharolyticus DSM 5350]